MADLVSDELDKRSRFVQSLFDGRHQPDSDALVAVVVSHWGYPVPAGPCKKSRQAALPTAPNDLYILVRRSDNCVLLLDPRECSARCFGMWFQKKQAEYLM